MSIFPPRRFQSRTRSEDILALFREMIRDETLKPGDRLPNERALAAHLGVSRPPLREAIRALAAMKLLEVRHGAGTFVSSLESELLCEPLEFVLAVDDSAVISLIEARLIVEPPAAALAAERITSIEVGALQEELQAGLRSQSSPSELVQHNGRFHALIHRASHNPFLTKTMSAVSTVSLRSILPMLSLSENAHRTIEEHTAIVEAICSHRPIDAAAAMRDHLTRIEGQLRTREETGEAPLPTSSERRPLM